MESSDGVVVEAGVSETSGDAEENVENTSCKQDERPKRNVVPPVRFIDETWDIQKERARSVFVRRKDTLTRLLGTANNLLDKRGSRQRLRSIAEQLESCLREFEEANDRYGSHLNDVELRKSLSTSEEFNQEVNTCLKEIDCQLLERAEEPPTPLGSTLSEKSRSNASSGSSEATKRARLAVLKLNQVKKETEIRRAEDKRRAAEEATRLEQELKCEEAREIRKCEYELETAQLEAQLARDEELQDPERLTNRLRDFTEEDVDARNDPNENRPLTPKLEGKEDAEEKLNVSWVQNFCKMQQQSTIPAEAKPAFVKSLPRLELPKFSGDPMEWPTFISLFKCLVHGQPLNEHPTYDVSAAVLGW